MAWNNDSEYYVALEGKDLQANAMAVDITGTYVLLAGRRYIAIRNLDNESEIVQKFPRQSKYDVGSAEWNPTMHHRELCVISSNQRLEVLTWRMEELAQTHSLKAHTRVITDLNWHQLDPNLLASCSVDTFIYIWDLRDPRRPSLSLSAIAEASQVRWNRISSNLLATAHDGDIKIWDQRKGTAPVQYVAAHLAKIHGLDWSRTSETEFATCSQDNTVKFFDTTNPRKAEYMLTTNAPVWRARYAPFGNGLITVVVPQLRRGENSLLLWNTTSCGSPMHTFSGHKDVVLEFAWRRKRTADPCYQLVTWSKDQTLLVWKIEPYIQKLCGHEPDDEIESSLTTKESAKKPVPKVEPLQQEFSLLNVQIPNLEVKSMNLPDRTCTVRASVNRIVIDLEVTFPTSYPIGVAPNFTVKEESKDDRKIGEQLLQTLNHLARQRVSKNRTCLESCLRQMVTSLEQLATDCETDLIFENGLLPSVNSFGGYNDAYIPFPRTSGAKFCSVDILVCFGRTGHSRRLSSKMDIATPRALSALESLLPKRSTHQLSISSYYYQKPRRTRSKNYISKTSRTAVVHVYNASQLFLANRQLAEEYILVGDITTICKHNAGAAALVGRWDLVQTWALGELVCQPLQVKDGNDTWLHHPFNNKLLQSLISHYASIDDIQTAAMLTCIFSKEQEMSLAMRKSKKYAKFEKYLRLVPSKFAPSKNSKRALHKSCGSPYHTLPPADMLAEGWVFPSMEPMRSSSSLDCLWPDQPSALSKASPITTAYEYYKLVYAETLERWGLLYNRTEVLKHLNRSEEVHKGVEFLAECKFCLKPSRSCNCSSCKRLTLNCVICHLSVKGSANCCPICGHAGHTLHLMMWFEKNDVCASGCGCKCLVEMANFF